MRPVAQRQSKPLRVRSAFKSQQTKPATVTPSQTAEQAMIAASGLARPVPGKNKEAARTPRGPRAVVDAASRRRVGRVVTVCRAGDCPMAAVRASVRQDDQVE